jgi:DNA (cytosine-5)-methyltransferase 1
LGEVEGEAAPKAETSAQSSERRPQAVRPPELVEPQPGSRPPPSWSSRSRARWRPRRLPLSPSPETVNETNQRPAKRQGGHNYKNSAYERSAGDFYPTPRSYAAALPLGLRKLGIVPPRVALDPCGGDGGLRRGLKPFGIEVVLSDLIRSATPATTPGLMSRTGAIDAADPEALRYALELAGPQCTAVITNTPYDRDIAPVIVKNLIALVEQGRLDFAAALFKSDWDNRKGRLGFFDRPSYVGAILCQWREIWIPGTEGSPYHEYSWFIWGKGHTGPETKARVSESEAIAAIKARETAEKPLLLAAKPIPAPTFIELFAGVGMARVGLGPGWRCLAANDFDSTKAETYRLNHGRDDIRCCDVAALDPETIPAADLWWLSPPCQDLSEAGGRAGLEGHASGAFWPSVRLLKAVMRLGRGPRLLCLENVTGLITQRGGQDFRAVVKAFETLGYHVGALVIDAAYFLPQSRERAFVVGVRGEGAISDSLIGDKPTPWHSPSALIKATGSLGLWWPKLPEPPPRTIALKDCFNETGGGWIEMTREDFGPPSWAEVEKMAAGEVKLGTTFRRTRKHGPVWETRFDGVAGCLRVATAGSSRASWLVVDGQSRRHVRRRFMTPREAAKLMGLPESFRLPTTANDALTCVGDGVAVPVVRYLAEHLIEPLLGETHESEPNGAGRLARDECKRK